MFFMHVVFKLEEEQFESDRDVHLYAAASRGVDVGACASAARSSVEQSFTVNFLLCYRVLRRRRLTISRLHLSLRHILWHLPLRRLPVMHPPVRQRCILLKTFKPPCTMASVTLRFMPTLIYVILSSPSLKNFSTTHSYTLAH